MAKIKGEKKYSIVTDHLGTPILGYNDTGDKVWERELDSFGKARMSVGEEGFTESKKSKITQRKPNGYAYLSFLFLSNKKVKL